MYIFRHENKAIPQGFYVYLDMKTVKIVGSYVELVKVVRLELVINYS